jgi:hypothetical protein
MNAMSSVESTTTQTLYAGPIAEQSLRRALRRHHDNLMRKAIMGAQDYAGSPLYAETQALLDAPETAWAPAAPDLHKRLKVMQYRLAYNGDVAPLCDEIITLLGDARRLAASIQPMGSGLPMTQLRALRASAADVRDMSKRFAARTSALDRLVAILDESLQSKVPA